MLSVLVEPQGYVVSPDAAHAPGALITTSERWIPAIALSLSSDGPQRFKTSVLHEIQDLFGNSGVFAGGFGNRSTDSGAYRATGISASRIFLVDETSQV